MKPKPVCQIDLYDVMIFQIRQKRCWDGMFSDIHTMNISDYYQQLSLKIWREIEHKYDFNGYDNYIDLETGKVFHK